MTINLSKLRRRRGFTLIELMIVVAIIGILAAIAIPALTKFIRKSKTSEFRANLAKMYDGNVAYFTAENVGRGGVLMGDSGSGATIANQAAHLCPSATPGTAVGSAQGAVADTTPGLGINCTDQIGGRCVPNRDYNIALWNDDATWNGLQFVQEQGHYGQYDFDFENVITGYGECRFTAQAFGDLDGDSTYSTYERAGQCTKVGCAAAGGLYVDQEVE